jgi:ABC-type nitrate/sulfonate/bicarbonate transport system substrate-binding protein
MEKNTKIIAVIAVVAIIVVAGIGAVLLSQPKEEGKKVIYWTTVAPINQKAALLAGTIDGAVGWEPYSSAAISDGTANSVIWSDQVWPNHPCCVLIVKKSFVDNNPANQDLVARVVRAHMDATAWILKTIQEGSGTNYTAMLATGAQFANVNKTVVQQALGHIEYGTQITDATKVGLKNFTVEFADLGQITGLGGYSNVTNFVNGIVNTSYLTMALEVTPSSTILGPVRLGYLNGDLHQFARVIAMNASLWGGETLFEKYGIDVTGSPAPFAAGGAVMDAVAANQIDMGYLGAPPAILKRINVGTQIEVISLVNMEGSAMVAKAPLRTLADLNGKLVGTPGPTSIQHLLLLYYATQNGYQVKLKGT